MGLGNPGSRYEGTRHNVGFEAVDRVARAFGIPIRQRTACSLVGLGRIESQEAVLAKPQTFMNKSGNAALSLLARYGQDPTQLLVIHDDLDLEVGRQRIKRKGGHGGHLGIQSILSALGTDHFTRIKIGIGRPVGAAEAYVLSAFTRTEQRKIDETLDKVVEAVVCVVKDEIEVAMNQFNQENL
jgi:peptidyl-tRNA hydrolase, PTH1 family